MSIGANGRKWEEDFADLMGAKLQPASGATPWAKLDAGTMAIIWSLKATMHDSYPISVDELDEAYTGARGLGAPGDVPAMGIRLGEKSGNVREVAVFDLQDVRAILESPQEFAIPMSKAHQRKLRAHGRA